MLHWSNMRGIVTALTGGYVNGEVIHRHLEDDGPAGGGRGVMMHTGWSRMQHCCGVLCWSVVTHAAL